MIRFLVKLIQKVQSLFIWILKQEGTPAERARGIAVGVFSGCFPFFGFQTLIGVFLASVLKGNYLLAVFATWISNPFTYIPLYWFNYQVGSIFLGGSYTLVSFNNLTQQQMWSQGWLISSRLLFGSTVVGLLAGLVFGYVSYRVFNAFNKIRD